MKHRTVEINERRFRVEADVATSFWDLWEANGWQPNTTRVFDRFVVPGKAVIDLGAWAGPLSLYAAQLTQASIHAVEPDQVVFRQLERNVSLNPDLTERFHSYDLAIGTHTSETQLFSRREFGDSSSSLLSRSRDLGDSVTIQVQRFEAFAKVLKNEPVGFIKMDIEGAEFEVIPDMAKWLAKHQPNLHLALHGNYLREAHFKGKAFGRFHLRLEERSGFHLWSDKVVKHKTLQVLEALSHYQYIYAENGQQLSVKEILASKNYRKPLDLVFTNESW